MQLSRHKAVRGCVLTLLAYVLSSSAFSQDEWPLVWGDYWEVTGIEIKDGGGWDYANWLATEWRENEEFAKSKGWIKDFMLLGNVHPRDGEPNVYLIRIRERLPTGSEGEQREKEFMEWKKASAEEMVEASGNRAEYREVMSSTLLQSLSFR